MKQHIDEIERLRILAYRAASLGSIDDAAMCMPSPGLMVSTAISPAVRAMIVST